LDGSKKNIIPKLKQFYREFFDKLFPVNFDGLDIMKTLEHAAEKYNLKFIIYHHDDNERLDHLNTIGESENKHNLLMISGLSDNTSGLRPSRPEASNNPPKSMSEELCSSRPGTSFTQTVLPEVANGGSNNNENIIVHVMYIKDIQKYTKLHICPKCGYIPPTTSHGTCYHKDLFDKYVENCDGNLICRLRLNEQSVPFIPHIQKNPVFAYLFANNRKNDYEMIEEYITFDFETVMKKKIT
jgi:hypothetical protein